MFKRFSMIALAAFIGGGLFLALVYFGGSKVKNSDSSTNDNIKPIPTEGHNNNPNNSELATRVRGYYWSDRNSNGQLIEVFGKSVTPKPHGILEFQRPSFRIVFSPQRILEVLAFAGTVDAPDNVPQNGELTGPVVVTLYENHNVDVVTLGPDSPHIQVRIFMTDATFNIPAGQIESPGPIHLTGPMVDFRGRGMSLAFSEKNNRIERFEIEQGQQLRFKPDVFNQNKSPLPPESDQTTSDIPPSPLGRGLGRGESTNNIDSPTPDKPAQYYRARFDSDLMIAADEWQFIGEWLDVNFAMQTIKQPNIQSPSDKNSSAADETEPADDHPQAYIPAGYQEIPLPEDKTLAPIATRDIIIRWSGPLVLEPLDTKPDVMADARDVMIQMLGQPLKIERSDLDKTYETIWARTLTYLASAKSVELEGSDPWFLTIESPELGAITADEKLTINLPPASSGKIHGPGELVAYENTSPDSSNTPPAQKQLSLIWTDSVDLDFFLQNDEIHSLKQAVFNGDITVKHDQFDLTSDENLTIDLTAPGDQDQTLDKLTADGNVHIQSHSTDPAKQLTFDANQMSIDVTEIDGDLLPQQLIATQSVSAAIPGQNIKSQNLTVNFALPQTPTTQPTSTSDTPPSPPGRGLGRGETSSDSDTPIPATQPSEILASPTTQPETTQPDSPFEFAIESMTAEIDVSIHIDKNNVTATADKLTYALSTDQFELTAKPDNTAVITTDQARIVSRHITIDQATENITIPAPGYALYNLAQTATPLDENQLPEDRIKIDWQDSLHLTRNLDIITTTLTGSIKAEILNGLTVATLTADEQLNFNIDSSLLPENTLQSQSLMPENDTPDSDDNNPAIDESTIDSTDADTPATQPAPLASRILRQLNATGNVTVTTMQYLDKRHGRLQNRLYITSPELNFNNIEGEEKFIFQGPGSMLIENLVARSDEQPVPDKNNLADNKPSRNTRQLNLSPTTVSGPGQTLFMWQKDLTLDALYNQVWFEQQVVMIHRAADSADIMQLDADHLIVDFEPTGGLIALTQKQPPQPKLTAIYAQGHPVTRMRLVWNDYECFADHLNFTAAVNRFELKADPPRVVQGVFNDQPFSAEKVLWNLDTGQATLVQPGTIEFNLE